MQIQLVGMTNVHTLGWDSFASANKYNHEVGFRSDIAPRIRKHLTFIAGHLNSVRFDVFQLPIFRPLIPSSVHLVQDIPIVIAGNKLDLSSTHREVRIEDVSEWVFCTLPKLR